MFSLPSSPNILEVWSVNHTSMYEKSELKVSENVKSLGDQEFWIMLIIIIDTITMD